MRGRRDMRGEILEPEEEAGRREMSSRKQWGGGLCRRRQPIWVTWLHLPQIVFDPFLCTRQCIGQ